MNVEELSKAVAERLGIPSHDYKELRFNKPDNELWLIDDTKRMAELAVEYDICISLDEWIITKHATNSYERETTKAISAYFVDKNRYHELDVAINDHPSKLHAWRYVIGLALLEVEV